MDTMTLLVIVGSVVCVKTLAFVSLIVRRDRRQRRALDAAVAGTAEARAAAHEARRPTRPVQSSWRLQWAEPGVLLVENTGEDAAREVRLVASLTAGCGAMAEVDQRERFVGTGACFLARFAELEEWLAEEGGLAGYVAPGPGRTRTATPTDGGDAAERLTCSFGYTLTWLTAEGEWCRETRVAQLVVPVPDLALETA